MVVDALQHILCFCMQFVREKVANLHKSPSKFLQLCPDDILARDPEHPEYLLL
jgi:hypothetical protein